MKSKMNLRMPQVLMYPVHGDHCTAACEANVNFSAESMSLMADNVWNEVVTLSRL
jgi:hypothetical protein